MDTQHDRAESIDGFIIWNTWNTDPQRQRQPALPAPPGQRPPASIDGENQQRGNAECTAVDARPNPAESPETALDTGSSVAEQCTRQVLTNLANRGFVQYQDPPAEHSPNGSHPEQGGGVLDRLGETPALMQQGALASKPIQELPGGRYYDLAKSALDTALCLTILPLVLLVMAVIAIAILIDSGRPVFFVQERAGRRYQPFPMYKFRTLSPDYRSESDREYMRSFVRGQIPQDDQPGTRIHKPIDRRQITRVGRVLRRTSLDELPQIFNVLRGEMSLVGPRPNVLWEVEAYQDWHCERLEVLPGITGLAQVRGRSTICFDDIVRHDIEYVRNQSLKLDLQILWWTVLCTLTGRGAR